MFIAHQSYLEMLIEFNTAWNHHDIEALMSFMTDDCEFHAVAGSDLMGKSYIGSKQVKEGFELAWKTFPDASWNDAVCFVEGNRGVCESTFDGTKTDGTHIRARMVDIFTFKDGKIHIKNAFRKDRPPINA